MTAKETTSGTLIGVISDTHGLVRPQGVEGREVNAELIELSV